MGQKRWKITGMHALKIAVGSSVAIYVAEILHLQFAASAGSIALLTLVSTKWDTVRLSLYRIVTFFLTIVLAYITFTVFRIEWVEYGAFIFALVMPGSYKHLRAHATSRNLVCRLLLEK